jgi:hypothetical protein
MSKRNPEIGISDDTPEDLRDLLAWLSQVPAATMAEVCRLLAERSRGEYSRMQANLSDEEFAEREQKRRERAAEYTEFAKKLAEDQR